VKTVNRIGIAHPSLSDEEKQAVLAVLDSGQLSQGPVVADLEARFADWCGVTHAVAVSSGTAGLHLALLASGITAGDEIITSPLTFIASANAALFVGARPVFADVDPDTFNLDPAAVEAAITPRTRAILPIHLYGYPAVIPELDAVAKRHGLLLIEDACQAHGATINGRKVGGFGISAVFSLYPSKNMIAGEGGLITTNDDAVAERAQMLRSHGASKTYEHEILGYNFRLSDIHAAIARGQLARLDGFNAARRRNARVLTQGLSKLDAVITPVERSGYQHVFHQYTIRVPGRRDELQRKLAERDVESRVYYPKLVHEQPLYQRLGYGNTHLPVAERLRAEVLSLPVHPGVSEDDLQRIIEAVWESLTDR
jgi:dTDP-4-amino-4,6-dideoxygalactose transaminase